MHWKVRSQKVGPDAADPGGAESNKNDEIVNIGFLFRNPDGLVGPGKAMLVGGR
ncbi:hypothetical protein KW851_18705 [Pseudomonas sp. PDM33]|uniref:hypothetical protein n=1 Tax=unclassified Pseudomonas TaxID=196821 RepID=UPI0012E07C46|nr:MULTISPECIES: hypothetical protein [unclassified Pseudomonas]MBV7584869.1 hypothetical protein [Pseudomonas sp. PDM33]